MGCKDNMARTIESKHENSSEIRGWNYKDFCIVNVTDTDSLPDKVQEAAYL